MTKTKHTPGPWHVSDGYKTSISAENGLHIATAWDGEVDTIAEGIAPIIEEARANACLIAAAPDLSEALENLVDLHKRGENKPTWAQWADAIEAAEKAIQKAKGE